MERQRKNLKSLILYENIDNVGENKWLSVHRTIRGLSHKKSGVTITITITIYIII